MQMENLCIFTHKRDLDGICSAAILKRYAKMHGIKHTIELIDYHPLGKLLRKFKKIGKLKGWFVIIADFCLNESVAKSSVSILSKSGCKIFWYDHHRWNKNVKNMVKKIVEKLVINRKLCAAEIVQKFYMNDEVSKRLAEMARDQDFYIRKNRVACKLSDLITYYDFLEEGKLLALIQKFSEGIFWEKSLEKEWKKYKKIKEVKLKELSKTTILRNLHRYKIGFAFVENFLSGSDACQYLLKKFGVDLAFAIFKNGKVSIRRMNKRIKCNEIGKLLGGGGHEFAAGASINRLKNKREYKNVVKKIVKLLEKHVNSFIS
jgi:oligoribonuclease NrnB/cAMP/cGMP phosphodiesterase (DHH superfamily)